jgi:hypothetical protein
MTKAFEKIKAGLEEALEIAKDEITGTVTKCRVVDGKVVSITITNAGPGHSISSKSRS